MAMSRDLRRMGATSAGALCVIAISACGLGESDKPPASGGPRDSAVADCAGNECRVRVVCKGRVYIRRGTAPVRIRTSKSPLTTTIVADFAGSREDAVIRC